MCLVPKLIHLNRKYSPVVLEAQRSVSQAQSSWEATKESSEMNTGKSYRKARCLSDSELRSTPELIEHQKDRSLHLFKSQLNHGPLIKAIGSTDDSHATADKEKADNEGLPHQKRTLDKVNDLIKSSNHLMQPANVVSAHFIKTLMIRSHAPCQKYGLYSLIQTPSNCERQGQAFQSDQIKASRKKKHCKRQDSPRQNAKLNQGWPWR